MAFAPFRDMKPFSQLMFSLFVVLVSFLAFFVLSIIVAIPFFGFDSMVNLRIISASDNPESIRLLKYLQVIYSISIFIVPPIILARFYDGNISKYLNVDKSVNFASVLLVLLLSFSAAPLINFIGEWNANMHFPDWLSGLETWIKSKEDAAAELTDAFLKVENVGGLIFNIFMIAILPAIGEELLFRGVIQRIFTNWTKSFHWGIWISAILFSALHMQFYGFIPRMLLGVLFGYLLVWSGSMWLPIIAHFINNGVAVVLMFLIDRKMISPELEQIGSTAESYYYTILSVVLVFIFLVLIKRENSASKLEINRF